MLFPHRPENNGLAMSVRVGLTGSIGMGKSTVGEMLRAEGISVFDADACVHELYGVGKGGTEGVAEAFGGSVLTEAGAVDRGKLSKRVLGDPDALGKLESIVHPLVKEARESWRAQCEAKGEAIVIYDIPLLFETGAEKELDLVIVVSCAPDTQKARVMSRPGMTLSKFESIVAKQIPDAEKRGKANFVIDTNVDLEATRKRVKEVLAAIIENHGKHKQKI